MAAMDLVELRHLLRGDYRCTRCEHAQRRLAQICPCVAAEFPICKPRHWVHYRRRIKPVLLTYCAILAVVLVVLGTRTGPRHYPFMMDVLIGHAVVCALVAVVIRLADAVLELFKRGRRWRLRATIFARVLSVWPLALAVVMVLVTALGWA